MQDGGDQSNCVGTFAVLTIRAAGMQGALPEARAALLRARPNVGGSIAGDIDRALASLGAPRQTPTAKAAVTSTGSPADALEVLRGLTREWRDRGSPPRAMKWRQAVWMATFPQHRQNLGRLPEGQRPQALIHDADVADWLSEHAGLSLGTGTWSEPRNRTYLAQMHLWAQELDCPPEDVELCMFESALGPGNQWGDG